LYKLLIVYFKNILTLVKLKNIFTLYKKSQNSFISLLYFSSKKEIKIFNLLINLNTFSKTKDLLIIGNTCEYLAQNSKNENMKYYFRLLKNQFLAA
jgi:hypothetical protein